RIYQPPKGDQEMIVTFDCQRGAGERLRIPALYGFYVNSLQPKPWLALAPPQRAYAILPPCHFLHLKTIPRRDSAKDWRKSTNQRHHKAP
ncbi:hypothetical protein, partial [Pseudaeromonas pectinilytica]